MKKKTARWLRDAYFDFFKKRGHRIIPSVSLVPEGDASALFISAGMHPLVPYLMGEPHPLGKRLASVQECVRTQDIELVGDSFHHTWFEMLGNWSLGDYFKEKAIGWSYEFLTKVLQFSAKKIAVTCFAGDKSVPRDTASAKVWRQLGIPEERIFFLPRKDNWWGPVSQTGPCGPDSEMFIDTGKAKCSPGCRPGCGCGKYIEIWNNVFMEFEKRADGKFYPLKQKNVDTGMGVERTVRLLLGLEDDYLTPIWQPIIKTISELAQKPYKGDWRRPMRIIADHLRAAVFIIADGIVPGNKEQSYVLRRLIRRSVRQGESLGLSVGFSRQVGAAVIANRDNYAGEYPELDNLEVILSVLEDEEQRFRRTLQRGLRELEKAAQKLIDAKKTMMSGKEAFFLYETFGFPLELIAEELGKSHLKIDEKEFEEEKGKHQQISRRAAKGRFKSGLADNDSRSIAYHTATHLLQAALRQILGSHVHQMGSNITPERLRFDFAHPRPLTALEIKKAEELVNQQIEAGHNVERLVMPFNESRKMGALAFFRDRYPEKVSVYKIGDFSLEVCRGPHVKNTTELVKLGRLVIVKQESCGAGCRRIYARFEK